MIDTINKYYAAKKSRSKFNVEKYYKALQTNQFSSTENIPTYTPGFQTAIQSLSANISELSSSLYNNMEPDQLQQLIVQLQQMQFSQQDTGHLRRRVSKRPSSQ